MKRVYPFHTRTEISKESYKADPDKATKWLELILTNNKDKQEEISTLDKFHISAMDVANKDKEEYFLEGYEKCKRSEIE